MKSIKSLITETEFRKMSLKIKPTDDEVNSISEYEWMTAIYPRRIFDETLKLCQEIQDAKVKELKKELDNMIDYNNSNFSYMIENYNILEAIDRIFGKETRAVKRQ